MSGQEATRAYRTVRADTFALFQKVDGLLVAHKKQQADDPENWGYAGDIGHVNTLLREIIDLLGGAP